MAEELEIKVTANTGEAVGNLNKVGDAVDKVKNKTKELDKEGSKDGAGGLGGLVAGADKATAGISKVMAVVGRATVVIGIAVAAYKAYSAALEVWSSAMDKAAAAENVAHERKIKFNKALALAKQGTIDLGRSTEEMLKNYDAYVAKMSPATKAIQEQTRALNEYKMALDQIAADINKANAGKGFTILSPEDAAAQANAVKSLAEGINNALAQAFKVGGAAERDAWAAANKEAIEKVMADFAKFGLEAPAAVKAAYERMKGDLAEVDPFAGVNEEFERNTQKQKEWIAETGRIEQGMRQWTDATQGAGKAFGALSGDFTQLNQAAQEWVAAGNDINDISVSMSVLAIQVAQATERQNASLRETLALTKAIREEQMATLDVAQGWNDYLAVMVDSFKMGGTSLQQFTQGLNQFKFSLLQTFGQGGAGSEAQKGLKDLLDMIQALINAAVGGSLGSGADWKTGMNGALDRSWKDAKENGRK